MATIIITFLRLWGKELLVFGIVGGVVLYFLWTVHQLKDTRARLEAAELDANIAKQNYAKYKKNSEMVTDIYQAVDGFDRDESISIAQDDVKIKEQIKTVTKEYKAATPEKKAKIVESGTEYTRTLMNNSFRCISVAMGSDQVECDTL